MAWNVALKHHSDLEGLENWQSLGEATRTGKHSQRESQVRVIQRLKGAQSNKGQNARNAEINRSDTKWPPANRNMIWNGDTEGISCKEKQAG